MLAAVPMAASGRLATAVGEWLATPSTHASHKELGERLVSTRAIINELELGFARDAAAFSATGDHELDHNPVAWMREQCRMTVNAAVNAVCIGEQENQLPRSIEALLDGRIGLSHLGLLAHTAAFAAQRPHPVTFDEAALLPKAERLNGPASAISATTPSTPWTPRKPLPVRCSTSSSAACASTPATAASASLAPRRRGWRAPANRSRAPGREERR